LEQAVGVNEHLKQRLAKSHASLEASQAEAAAVRESEKTLVREGRERAVFDKLTGVVGCSLELIIVPLVYFL
jgi:hypothetical protein